MLEKGEGLNNVLHKDHYRPELGSSSYTLYWVVSIHDLHDVRRRKSMGSFVIDAFKYAMGDWGYDFLGLKDYALHEETFFRDKNYAW